MHWKFLIVRFSRNHNFYRHSVHRNTELVATRGQLVTAVSPLKETYFLSALVA